MLFILPIRTSVRPWRTPYTNYALIAINAIIFLLSYAPHINPMTGGTEILRLWAVPFMLTPARPELWQFISYGFLHSSIMHIVGNMFFLYLFGNNVNDKLGSIGYVCLYLAGAVCSGLGHSIFSNNPVIGASGAVAAITGAYLVLFPQTLITVFYWIIYFINTAEIPALYFIGFKLIFWDNIAERNMPNVAYGAHLSGYTFGILASLLLLSTGLISPSGLDLWNMIKQWNRRRVYRDAVSSGYDPFAGRLKTKKARSKQAKKTADELKWESKTSQLRDQINNLVAERNLPEAANIYLELMAHDSKQILPSQSLLDIGNQLASENKSSEAARTYEQFLVHYSNYEYIEQIELMLGLLYSRYLHESDLAIKHLKKAAKRLSDPGQFKMCQDELERLKE